MNHLEKKPTTLMLWKNFIETGKLSPGYVRPEIERSWIRCRNAQVDPFRKGSSLILEAKELDELRFKKQDLIKISRPIMENLYKFVAGTGFLVLLSDERGFIMEILGDRDTWKNAQNINLISGSSWVEEEGGTNGIGTALVLQKPVQITGAEHYCKEVQAWTCSACPILNDKGMIIGVLQMSGPSHATHLHTLGMVVAAAQAIVEQIRVQQKNRELILVNNRLGNIFDHMSDGVIILDSEGISTHVNPAAEKILNKSASTLLNTGIESVFNGKCCTQIKELLTMGKSFADVEVLLESEKSYHCCLVSGKSIQDEKENIGGGVLIIKSLNKIKNLVNRLSGAQANFHFDDIIGQSPEIREAVRIAMLAAESDSNVILCGESGTGKEMFAQAIHNLSFRKNGPFVALNCGAIPRELIGSELFGYVDGAFTGAKKGGRPGKFELAGGGTLFLDEIGDMNFGKQASLLRAIQERKIVRIGGDKVIPVDVRIISATNKNLHEEVEKGNFRQDLFYRLNVISVTLPPLRKRPDDIPLMFNYFLQQECRRMGTAIKKIDPEVIYVLQQYSWPGNIRQLQNIAERMACIARDRVLNVGDLPPEILAAKETPIVLPRKKTNSESLVSIKQERQKRKEQLAETERAELINMLVRYGGNISKVAEQMGVSRNTIYRKIKEYKIKK